MVGCFIDSAYCYYSVVCNLDIVIINEKDFILRY